jgi:outer membrane protein OmpA-like peptidoglycan-associated protein
MTGTRTRTAGFSAALLALASTFFTAPAQAQTTVQRGFAVDRFDPSERGSDWFALESLDLRGGARPAFGLVLDYGYRPLVLYGSDGDVRVSVLRNQTILHAGGNIVLAERLRLSADLPIAVYDHGRSAGAGNTFYEGPADSAGIGDVRLGADLRLAGEYGSPFTVALGAHVYIPTGSRSDFTSDGSVRVEPRLMAAGTVGLFTYAARAGVMYRSLDGTFAGQDIGSELTFGASAGLRLGTDRVTLGPEVMGSTVLRDFFAKRDTPVEVLLGAHVKLPAGFRLGAGGGPGISRGIGEPAVRVLGSLEWSAEPPLAGDRDHDGILDPDDACPNAPGIRTDDPATNGCPVTVLPDRDQDGVPDASDACPDVRGIATDDPKTNGCPADRDKDSVPDAVDACPDVPGVASDDPARNGCPPDRDNDTIVDSEDACPDIAGTRNPDPKLNGCPPDRDNDGILDGKDACPDEAGPPSEDPKKNGCPRAVVKNGQIRINEQIKFRFNKADIDPASDPILEDVARILKDHPEIAHLRIEGHTDDKGSRPYNLKLSDKRAAAIKGWLVKHNVDAARLTSVGFGATKPIDSNSTEQGRRNNRRVEFHIEGGVSGEKP